ncbi:MAG: hypothetical protein GVY18_14185, partial [Bacteroidetes bacterium]|nr:hypothetical protein [Bacteroidota bacterium]
MRERGLMERWPFSITHHGPRTTQTHHDRRHQYPDINTLNQYQTSPPPAPDLVTASSPNTPIAGGRPWTRRAEWAAIIGFWLVLAV